MLVLFIWNFVSLWTPFEKFIKSLKNNIPDFKSKNQFPPLCPNGKLGEEVSNDNCVKILYKYGCIKIPLLSIYCL